MCTGLEPMMIASLAATTAGSLYNANTQNNAISAQNSQNQQTLARERTMRDAEVSRQRAFEDAQAGEVTNALFEAAPERIAERGQAAAMDEASAINTAADTYNAPVLTGQVQNNDVNDSIGSTIANAVARTREMLRAASTLQGQGDGLADAAASLGRMGSQIQTIGSNRAGSSRVAMQETAVPTAQVTKSSSPIGDLLMLGGQLAGGMSGKSVGKAGGPRPFDIGSIFSRNQPLSATA
jgi:hypothetical protein